MRDRIIRSSLIVLVVLTAQLYAQEPETKSSVGEFSQLDELLRQARPAPENGRFYPEGTVHPPEHRVLLSYDLVTGETISRRLEDFGESNISVAPGQMPIATWHVGGEPLQSFENPSDQTGNVFGSDAETLSCTPPPRTPYAHDFPFSTTYKLLMRFNVSGIDYYQVCSASSFGSFHLLTAGHCLFSWDPNFDGDTSDRKWADEVWAFAAQSDVVNPFGSPDRPFGYAKAMLIDVYGEWVFSQDWEYDLGYIALDRRAGDQTGWMWREANLTTTTLNFNGYPAEAPYVPDNELSQYHHADPGNVDNYYTNRIQMCAYTYGGHSGGPVWRYDSTGGVRYVQGVNSTSTRTGTAHATRLTSERLTHMDLRISNDEIDRPPVARPELVEFAFSYNDDTKDIYPISVQQDHVFYLKFSVQNMGFAASGLITVDFYLSDNEYISDTDTKIGTTYLNSIDAGFFYIVPDWPLLASVNPGTYYVGWMMSSAVPEYGGDLLCGGVPCSNVAVVGDETLTVTSCQDFWEPDGNQLNSSQIFSSVYQEHGLCPIGDEDWFYFVLNEPSQLFLLTSGVAGDTEMWLYNSGLGLIEYDDNDGSNDFSLINRSCSGTQLSAGTYFVKVSEKGSNQVIDNYLMALSITPCTPLIFSDSFESGNTSGWSDTTGG